MITHRCPHCSGAIDFRLFKDKIVCCGCETELELKPSFLSTGTGAVLFFSVSLLIGSLLSEPFEALSLTLLDRFLLDSFMGTGYYLLCRLLFANYQRPVPKNKPHENQKSLKQ